MTTTATLDAPSVTLDPGGVGSVPLVIRNNGDIVEGYHLEVVGPARGWASVEPAEMSLYPGASATASVMFFPPRSATVPAGELRYGVRVVPTEHPEEAVVPEGSLDVLPFTDTTAELVPRTSQGRRGARARVAVDNRGNQAVTVALRAWDQAQGVDFELKPPGITVPAGQAAFVDVRMHAATTSWRGPAKTLPFTVGVDSPDATSITLDGTFLQQPMLPRWLLKAALLALLVLAGLAALWFWLLEGAVESAAQKAAQEQVVAAEEAAAQAQEAAEAAGAQAGTASGNAEVAEEAAGRVEDVAGQLNLATSETPLAERLEVRTAAGGPTRADEFVIPAGQTLELTDLVLSNPQGDFGRVRIQIADRVLFDSALENFRDLDYHFVTPIVGVGGENLTMTVRCNTVGVPLEATPVPTQCDTAMYFGGVLSQPVEAGPAPAAPPAPETAAAP